MLCILYNPLCHGISYVFRKRYRRCCVLLGVCTYAGVSAGAQGVSPPLLLRLDVIGRNVNNKPVFSYSE
jgi:hypothetical protein